MSTIAMVTRMTSCCRRRIWAGSTRIRRRTATRRPRGRVTTPILVAAGAYYKTLVALRNLTAARASPRSSLGLPYGDERSAADDAKIVEGLVGMVLP